VGFTFWPPASEPLLPLKLTSPLYCAVTVWLPTLSDEVLVWPMPLLRVTGPPKFAPSIMNWMVPVAVPDPGAVAVTMAVKVTFCPLVDGLADEVTLVAVLSLLTTWVVVALLPV
jgi:hypothetical protein